MLYHFVHRVLTNYFSKLELITFTIHFSTKKTHIIIFFFNFTEDLPAVNLKRQRNLLPSLQCQKNGKKLTVFELTKLKGNKNGEVKGRLMNFCIGLQVAGYRLQAVQGLV